MPAESTDYSKCKIYALTHATHGHILIKYTTLGSLDACLSNHKKRSKTSPSAIYKWIEQNGGWEPIDIYLVEDYPCENNAQLHDRISYWTNELKPITKKIHESMQDRMYKNGKIYKFVTGNGDTVYVGSTKNSLVQRMNTHLYVYTHKPEKCQNVYKWISENGGFESLKIELIENYPCDSKKELEARERYWIEMLNPITNHILPTRSKQEYKQLPKMKEKEKEYRERNRDIISVRRKEYRETHKEEVSQAKKDWYERNKERVKERVKRNYEQNKEAKLEYQRKYGQEHKEKIAEASKAYREANAEIIREKQKERRKKMDKEAARAYHKEYRAKLKENKVHCEACGIHVMQTSLKNHMKCKAHQDNVCPS